MSVSLVSPRLFGRANIAGTRRPDYYNLPMWRGRHLCVL